MSSTPEPGSHGANGAPGVPGEGTAHVRTRTPRPDELSREAFQFIAAIDEYKRKNLRSFLDDAQVLAVAHELGWYPGDAKRKGTPTKAEVERYAVAREGYRRANGRLFPSWSEVFEILLDLGYVRSERAA
jgi:hypothetical protein